MIEIVHPDYEEPLILRHDSPSLLVVENPSEFYKTVEELRKQFDGGDGDYIFSENGREVSVFDKGFFIPDPFVLDFEDKKLTNALYKYIEKSYVQSDHILKLNELNTEIFAFLQSLTYDYDFILEHCEMSLPALLKAVDMHAASHYDGYLEKLICFMNYIRELKKIEFFVFVNLKTVLDDNNLNDLYSHCETEKIPLLLIESNCSRKKLPCERQKIITEDLCEIIVN